MAASFTLQAINDEQIRPQKRSARVQKQSRAQLKVASRTLPDSSQLGSLLLLGLSICRKLLCLLSCHVRWVPRCSLSLLQNNPCLTTEPAAAAQPQQVAACTQTVEAGRVGLPASKRAEASTTPSPCAQHLLSSPFWKVRNTHTESCCELRQRPKFKQIFWGSRGQQRQDGCARGSYLNRALSAAHLFGVAPEPAESSTSAAIKAVDWSKQHMCLGRAPSRLSWLHRLLAFNEFCWSFDAQQADMLFS